jgi:hypothetical protein
MKARPYLRDFIVDISTRYLLLSGSANWQALCIINIQFAIGDTNQTGEPKK